MASIADSLRLVRERIAEAALRAGRTPESVLLVAVSKTMPPEVVREAFEAGQRDFGENRVEEALPKMRTVGHDEQLRWHMIGHVQSRKARDVAGAFVLVHSVDSLKLARKLNDHVPEGRAQEVLLECNVSGEASKYGFALHGWEHDAARFEAFAQEVAAILALPRLRVRGLMTMAPIVEAPEQARPFFASLRALRDALRARFPDQPEATFEHLSMGMTDDFEAAIAEGATIVRIGRAIFGARA
ncbi:MAG: YggS family pyridoxal phosphate-dependent enzyme [Thermoflexales bacterium]|nr:YggS family pyridoxal phosphate-dependent enzyme [Thermoflexales bacterium]MCS7325115.1 YggS family pyridoxal phosphate-dependent enzyme [Thermoflexales bacterium]MCX7938704.1 YggS family pyridoxal phosphate-dependent enzyme [Thermoflexales bacterium]MDW8054803.1 YggS family pyridoxal phosphate-dependent enzyme [Anaerolineae bacterium]MDW8292921.1 YggS family pyridoxal phosphate-dependent enzyme [Anaerolineae bacterium]